MNFKNIIIAESKEADNFYPLSILHCIWEIRTGAKMLFERYKLLFNDVNIYFATEREGHLNSFKARFDIKNSNSQILNDVLIVNASVLADINFKETLQDINIYGNTDFICNDAVNFIFRKSVEFDENKSFENYKLIDENTEQKAIDNIVNLHFLWEALDVVQQSIENDAYFYSYFEKIDRSFFKSIFTINENKIVVGKDISIAPGVVLDASKGAIILDDNVTIMAHAVICGPCYIGKHTLIKIGAKIYENCAIGQHCKIGGELENTIIQSFSNKQHDGFLGHSYLCEWINLGADTNNSDLKNTYSKIKVKLRDTRYHTGRQFMGLLCGDHTKSAINTMFNTGTVSGISAILFDPWFLPTSIGSFVWGGANHNKLYNIEVALDTMKIVMSRRGKTLLPEEEMLIRNEYEFVQNSIFNNIGSEDSSAYTVL